MADQIFAAVNLQEQARALGDPTRHSIFRYLAESPTVVDVAELTSRFSLNHNAIRQHLAKLIAAGLVLQSKTRSAGPGRPRFVYRIHPAADARWAGSGPYQHLSLLLLEMVSTGRSAEEVGRSAGHRLGVASGGSERTHAELLADAIARGGFQPTMASEGEKVEFTLSNCPFADAAESDAATICGLHLGMAMGLADQMTGVSVDHLVPRDPHKAGCRLGFRLDADELA